MNTVTEQTALQALQAAVDIGVTDFCICPGARNTYFISILKNEPRLNVLYFYDERSAGFFALGRSRASQKPVAVITTSGTAPAHLLPAAMEAYYTGVPLLLISADRPSRFRGCNTPQACEQVGLFGIYAPFAIDLEEDGFCSLSEWDRRSPAHLNVCLEEPAADRLPKGPLKLLQDHQPQNKFLFGDPEENIAASLHLFLEQITTPLVVVSAVKASDREAIAQFLLRLNAPVFFEAPSGLREDPRLKHLRIARTEKLWHAAEIAGYPIDGILRIGGVPTIRLWRDLEQKQGSVHVFSINDVPFSGLSWGPIACTSLAGFFNGFYNSKSFGSSSAKGWLAQDRRFQEKLQSLYEEEPRAEQSLMHEFSKKISPKARIFLGNSLPIRIWDLCSTNLDRNFQVFASRGLNGIDGQISTFLGLCSPQSDNWGLFGDLTTLHDMSGPWIMSQLKNTPVTIVVVNNGGGKIFAKMFPDKEIQNEHTLHFHPLASLWGLAYQRWTEIPERISMQERTLIEITPDNDATERFWKKMAQI